MFRTVADERPRALWPASHPDEMGFALIDVFGDKPGQYPALAIRSTRP